MKRHKYLARALKAYERNAWIDRADIHVYLDGLRNPISDTWYGKKGATEACEAVFDRSYLPNKELVRQPHNVGTAVQVCMALEDLFKTHKYVTVTGCDFLPNRFHVKSLIVLYRQFAKNPRAGFLNLGPTSFPYRDGHIQTRAEAKDVEDLVEWGSWEARWALNLWRRTWRFIGPTMRAYHAAIKAYDYRQLVDTKWGRGKRKSPNLRKAVRRLERKFGSIHEDMVPYLAGRKKGLEVLHALAPRLIPMTGPGAMGRTARFHYRLGWDRYKLYDVGGVLKYRIASEIVDEPVPLTPSPKMVYRGLDTQPFTIRGDVSRKTYWKVQKGRPFDVCPEDITFLEKHGFERL